MQKDLCMYIYGCMFVLSINNNQKLATWKLKWNNTTEMRKHSMA